MKEKLITVITDETRRKKVQYVCVFLFLAAVSAFMTVLNIVTGKGSLTAATAGFTVLCLADFVLVVKCKRVGPALAQWMFMIEIVVLLTFFVISGNPDGFSSIWVAMLPGCGMLLFGKKRGSILCLAMLAILIFFFWIPAGRSLLQFDYNKTFMMRFPILYAAFFVLSALLEIIREITQNELDKMRETYKYLSAHDYLTQLLNRSGLEELRGNTEATEDQAVFMVDIDHFKRINDRYGHNYGDIVLAKVAEEIKKISNVDVCRWGGEEFVLWFPDSRNMCDPESIRRGVEQLAINKPNSSDTIKVTVSIGAATGSDDFDLLVQRADECMYKAKTSGRNRVVTDAVKSVPNERS